MGFTPLPITAWSAVNALGTTTRDVLAALDAGRSGLAPPPFELPFTAKEKGPGKVESKVTFFICTEQMCARQVRTETVNLTVE